METIGKSIEFWVNSPGDPVCHRKETQSKARPSKTRALHCDSLGRVELDKNEISLPGLGPELRHSCNTEALVLRI